MGMNDNERLENTAQSLRTVLQGKDNIDFYNKVGDDLNDPVFKPFTPPETKNEERDLTLKWLETMAEKGLTQIGFPEEYGGGGDFTKQIRAYEIMAYLGGSAIIKPGVQLGLFGGAIDNIGEDHHKKKYLNDIMNVKLLGCFLMTEQDNGSNAANIQTTATYIPETDEIEINTPHDGAIKRYIGNGIDGQKGVAFVRLIVDEVDYGPHVVLVPLRDEPRGPTVDGVEIVDEGRKVGLNGVDNVRVRFNKLRVPRENLLSKFAKINMAKEYESDIEKASTRFFTTISTLISGRMFISATSLSFAKLAQTRAIRYATDRNQFGQGLMEFPVYRQKVLPLVAKTYALDFVKEYAFERLVNKTEHDSVEVESLVSALKAYSTWHAGEALTIMREACGGDGYIEENGFGQLKEDNDVFKTFEGANDVLMGLYGKNRLKAFGADYKSKTTLERFKFNAGVLLDRATHKNPARLKDTSPSILSDLDRLVELLQFRDKEMVLQLADDIRKDPRDRVEATVARQTDLNALGSAHIEAVAIEKMRDALVNEDMSPDAHQLLTKTAQLFALKSIEDNAKWYLENGYLGHVQSKAVTELIGNICTDIVEDGSQVALVNGFGIPEHLVDVPMLERAKPNAPLYSSNLMEASQSNSVTKKQYHSMQNGFEDKGELRKQPLIPGPKRSGDLDITLG